MCPQGSLHMHTYTHTQFVHDEDDGDGGDDDDDDDADADSYDWCDWCGVVDVGMQYDICWYVMMWHVMVWFSGDGGGTAAIIAAYDDHLACHRVVGYTNWI